MTTQPRQMVFELTTNSLFVATFEATAACGSTQGTVIRKIPLSADGSHVVGPVQAVTVCASGEPFIVPIGLSRGVGSALSLAAQGFTTVNTAIFTIDPQTLAVAPSASFVGNPNDPMVNTAAVYSHTYNKTALVDTFKDRLRLASAGGLWTLVPETSDPMVSSAGGSSEQVTMTEIDFGGLGLVQYGAGLAGCNGPQILYGNGAPEAGTSSFRLVCSNPPDFSLGLGLLGNVPDPFGTDYFSIGVPVFIDVFASTQFFGLNFYSNGSGDSVSDPIAIPANLVGSTFYAQAFWVWSTCSIPLFNVSSSNGLAFTIQ
jgi:hypothetical protein